MGIPSLLNLLKSITTKRHLKDYKDKIIAVDVYTWLHPAIFTCSYELANNIETSKHIDFCVKRVDQILSYGISKVVLVFDGRQLPSKKGTEEERKKNREGNRNEALKLFSEGKKDLAYKKFASSIDVTPQMAYEFIQVRQSIRQIPFIILQYQAMKGRDNVECIVSPYEADAQLAYLSRTNYVDVVLSEDSDLLAFGCKKVLFKLYKGEQRDVGDEICLENLKHCKEINMSLWDQNMFLTACIFAGCDYLPSIKGVIYICMKSSMGINRAFRLVGDNKTYKKCLYEINSSKSYQVPVGYDQKFESAFLTFRFQKVFCPIKKQTINLNQFDIEALKQQYVEKDSVDFKSQTNWKDFEDNVLIPTLIFKIISQNFNWSFLGEYVLHNFLQFNSFFAKSMDDSIATQVSKCEIDPETLQPYKEVRRIEGLNLEGQSSNPVQQIQGGLSSLQQKAGGIGKKSKKKTDLGKQKTLNFLKVSKNSNDEFPGEKSEERNGFLLQNSQKLQERHSESLETDKSFDGFSKNMFKGKSFRGPDQMKAIELFGPKKKDIMYLKKKSDLKRGIEEDYFTEGSEDGKNDEEPHNRHQLTFNESDGIYKQLPTNNDRQTDEDSQEQARINAMMLDSGGFLNQFKSNLLISKNLEAQIKNHHVKEKPVAVQKSHKLMIDHTPIQDIQVKKPSLFGDAYGMRRVESIATRPNEEEEEEEEEEQEEILKPNRIFQDKTNVREMNQVQNESMKTSQEKVSKVSRVCSSSTSTTCYENDPQSGLENFTRIVNGDLLIDSEFLIRKHPEYNFLQKFSMYFESAQLQNA